MIKTLLIVRHAHRSKEFGKSADNGLTEKGRAQSRRIVKCFEKRFGEELGLRQPSQVRLLSSPKKRCVETLEPLAQALDARIDNEPLLDEGDNLEERVRRFVERWKDSSHPLTVVCSHGDFIPALLDLLVGVEIEMKKGGWAQVDWMDGRARLFELIQKP